MNLKTVLVLGLSTVFLFFPVQFSNASHNSNLFVSAENPQNGNHFSGSMVVEVMIYDQNLRDTDEIKGEPDVTLNGKSLRMVQAASGDWYAYFANIDKAKTADASVGLPGQGLDFGVFCSNDTDASIFGVSLHDSAGFSVPSSSGLSNFTNGDSEFSKCTGSPTGFDSLNNVVRKAKSINSNSNILSGQIGLNHNAWPLIQLFSFDDDVVVRYEAGGISQSVLLEYGDISDTSLSLDRDSYPSNAEVFLSIGDPQLNQDPTDTDSWTFGINPKPSTFYQAFDSSGNNASNGDVGLVDLSSNLLNLGFEDNGQLSLDLGNVLGLKTNHIQPVSSISDGNTNTFSGIVTLVETEPNSGIFETADYSNQSVLQVLDSAPRGQSGQVTYGDKSLSILSGSDSASFLAGRPPLIINDGQPLVPGTNYSVLLTDSDQNLNYGARDSLDVFRDSAIVPTITIGNPLTLETAHDVHFHHSSSGLSGGIASSSMTPDSNSDRLLIDTSDMANGSYGVLSINLGLSSDSLYSSLIDTSKVNSVGTNWINYDLRSFANDLGVSDFSDTSFTLYFGSLGSFPVTIIDAGDLASPSGFFQLDDADIQDISDKTGNAFLVIDFDSSGDGDNPITISDESNKQPIVFDLFSLGMQNNKSISNSIYRFELEETSKNSSVFEGTVEFAVTNQVNVSDPDFIKTIRSIDNKIKIIVTDSLSDDEGLTISYLDLDKTGTATNTSSKSDALTNSGTLSASSATFRFGQPVTVTLKDPDLNLKSDLIEIYQTVNNPDSQNVDTIGRNGDILLEVKLKDTRYKRCTIDGIAYGGLASTGFALVETGKGTGIFEGVFKMPSTICDKSGTSLISTAGGSLDIKYYDSHDAYGNPNVISLLKSKSPSSYSMAPQLSISEITLPVPGNSEMVVLSGNVKNHVQGTPLAAKVTYPDGNNESLFLTLSPTGNYKSVITIHENSLIGLYQIVLTYQESHVGTISFNVHPYELPSWVKNNAKWWSSSTVSNSEFFDGLEYLIQEGLITVPLRDDRKSPHEKDIPLWVKNNAKWWSEGIVSDDEFIKSIQYLINMGVVVM